MLLHSFPRAIIHIDGDAFFTSCEEAVNPKLKGKPLATGIMLCGLQQDNAIQQSLFADPVSIAKIEAVSRATDAVNAKFGKHTLHVASTMPVDGFTQHLGERGDTGWRKKALLKGETKRQRLGIPMVAL